MLTLEQILELALANGATVTKDSKNSGIGYTDKNGRFHKLGIDDIILTDDAFVFCNDSYECYAA